MPILQIHNLASIGVLSSLDITPYEAPPEAWSSGHNVRFEDGKVKKFRGDTTPSFGTASIVPYALFSAFTVSQAYWIYAGLNKVYVTDMSGHFNITRQTAGVDVNYNANEAIKWNGGSLNSVPIINNGIDAPQMWLPVASSQRLQELGNWSTFPGGSSARARVLRPGFRFFLIAMDMTIGGQTFQSDIVWSHPADPGAVPNTWNYSDTTNRAGRASVGDTPGACVDLVPLTGKTGIIYKADSSYSMQFVGGTSVFAIDPLFPELGLLATNCAKRYSKGHFVVTQDDIIVHNGRDPRSIISSRVKKQLQALIDPTYKDRSFVIQNFSRHEMWFYFVEANSGATQPNMLFVWNWDNESCSFAKVVIGFGTNGCSSAALGAVDDSSISQVWDNDGTTWDSDQTVWDERLYDPANTQILQAAVASQSLLHADSSLTPQRAASIERLGLSLIGKDRQGNLKSDKNSIKFVKRIIPRFSRTSQPVHIQVGSQEIEDGPITWSPNQLFDPATMLELPVDVVGRFIGVRFETLEGEAGIWNLDSYGLDLEIVGGY